MSYRDDVRAARDQFEGAVVDAAAEALRIAEEYGKPLSAVCKDIAGPAWNALRQKAQRLGATPAARTRAVEQAEMRRVRTFARKNPEAVAREIAKVNPDVLLDVATEAQGRTRSKAPTNQAKVEQAFGPEEFNRLEYAIEAVLERLPDLAPTKDDRGYAEELAEKAEALAGMLRGWANGEDIGREAEEWLQAR